jgi:hypothetical protein
MNSMKNIQIANVPAANISAAAASAAVTTATSDAEDASTADFAPDTSVPVRAKPKAKPSSVKNEKQKATNNKHQNDIKASRLRLATACIDDTGIDIFMKDNSNFACATVANLLATAELACTGWPTDVRLFSWYPGGKGTGAWRDPEMVSLNATLDARKGGPEQGLRFERRKRLSGSFFFDLKLFSILTIIQGPMSSSAMTTAYLRRRALRQRSNSIGVRREASFYRVCGTITPPTRLIMTYAIPTPSSR